MSNFETLVADGPTDGPTDRRTLTRIELLSQLKIYNLYLTTRNPHQILLGQSSCAEHLNESHPKPAHVLSLDKSNWSILTLETPVQLLAGQ